MPTLEDIHRHVDLAADGDPHQALIAVRKLIEDDVPWLERRAVQLARLERWGWARIARLLLRSRQAVRERFDGVDALPLPDFVSDDPWAIVKADAEAWLQRSRDAYAARERAEARSAEASRPPPTTGEAEHGSAVESHASRQAGLS